MQAGLAANLEPIRARFLKLLQERKAEIQHNLEVAAEAPDQADQALLNIAAVLHKIAGTAGTLGFEQLGTRAREIENLILEHNGDQSVQHSELYPVINAFLDQPLQAT
ncbi:Hpt domain-containing protein [Lentibacter sp. XHP0401]|jgi:HPt (histidine-containing phosphotransfer) domain-containing protein|uniref:Hpt domain-containing protein n=1 Tax=Lentibacter sp. XHP0401 TaxID=2984334 RepID=UPI0021E7E447|nr:Hpt domain-containing protein [Lentibacter sp. XHP0401]MCV2894238.1 Hpt domain-containing protein [Lentibacter sp. XHP0401]